MPRPTLLPVPAAPSPARTGRPRVVIVGAGFAGLAAVRGLRRAPVEVTVTDRTNRHLFQPLIYQVATALLSPGEIAPALRAVLRAQHNATVRLAETTGVDLPGRSIEVLEAGGASSQIRYDYLVVAAGSRTSFFGHEDWAQWLYPIKTIAEATRLRDQISCAYERAAEEPDPNEQTQWKTFAIVGAGPTGVEIAGQLASLARERDDEPRQEGKARTRIVLIDALEEVLSPFPRSLRTHTHRQLTEMGVEFQLGAMADAIDPGGITVKRHDGRPTRIDARTVIWAAGVRASPLAKALCQGAGIETDHKGRVPVRPDSSLPGHLEVFVIGDMANLDDLPGLSEPAIQAGRHVAKVLRHLTAGRRAPRPFRYLDLGTMATISPTDAIADIFGLQLHGRLGKLAWATVHIAFLVGWGNRVGVQARWAFLLGSRTRPERAIFTTVPDHRSPAHPPAEEAAAGDPANPPATAHA